MKTSSSLLGQAAQNTNVLMVTRGPVEVIKVFEGQATDFVFLNEYNGVSGGRFVAICGDMV